jgi:hypothetical protein
VRDDIRRVQHRAHFDAARHGKFFDTGVRHFLLGAVVHLARRVVTTTRVALLVATLNFAATCALARDATHLAAVHLPAVAATADIENPAAPIATTLAKAVLRLLMAVRDARHA